MRMLVQAMPLVCNNRVSQTFVSKQSAVRCSLARAETQSPTETWVDWTAGPTVQKSLPH